MRGRHLCPRLAFASWLRHNPNEVLDEEFLGQALAVHDTESSDDEDGDAELQQIANEALLFREADAPLREHVQQAVSSAHVAGSCVVCFEKTAEYVHNAEHKHLVVCTGCRRKLVFKELVRRNDVANTSKARRNLTLKQLSRTRIPCPICREDGRLVNR